MEIIAASAGPEVAANIELAARSTACSAKQSSGLDPGTEKLAGEARRRAHSYKVEKYSDQVQICAERKMLGLCAAGNTVEINTR
jgi:hypothetical protein